MFGPQESRAGAERVEQERGQEPVSVIALQLPALCLENPFSSPDTFLCFGDAESFNMG